MDSSNPTPVPTNTPNPIPQTPGPNVLPAQPPSKGRGRYAELKNLVIKILIGCLIVSAGLSVAAILLGGLTDILTKALETLGLVALHALAALAYIETPIHGEGEEELIVFSNALFAAIVASFITSVLGVWLIISGDVVGKLYGTYFVLLFAILHGDLLSKTKGKTSTIDMCVMANYLFMVAVVLMILPPIWMGTEALPEYYYRVLSALGIIDATLTITAVAMHKLYLNKHPEAKSQLFEAQVQLDSNGKPVPAQIQVKKRRMHPLVLIVVIYIAAQIAISLGALLINFGRH